MDHAGRYRLTLTLAGRRVMRGWWAEEPVARGQIPAWVRDWGVPGARIVLVDTADDAVLVTWPADE